MDFYPNSKGRNSHSPPDRPAESSLSNDADGNITQDGTWSYTYDGENRLLSMTKPGTTISFLYQFGRGQADNC